VRDNPRCQSGNRGHDRRKVLVPQRGHPQGTEHRIIRRDITAKIGGLSEGALALSVCSVDDSRVFRALCLQLAVPPYQVVASFPGFDQGGFHRDEALGLTSEGLESALERCSPSHEEGRVDRQRSWRY
jgi:hypothetical protein